MLRKILVAVNSVILQFFYTGIKQELYKLQQYGNDLREISGDDMQTATIKTGQKYRTNGKLHYFTYLVIGIIIFQYIYLEYCINSSFRLDINFLSMIAIVLMIGTLALPALLVVCFYYKPSYIGSLLLDSKTLDPLSDFLSINYFSIITWLSGSYILCNILYLLIFNTIHFISIAKIK